MTEVNTIVPVAMDDLRYSSDEGYGAGGAGETSGGGADSSFESSFEKVHRRSSSAASNTPLPPDHLVEPHRPVAVNPPTIYTTSDGARGFEARPRSALPAAHKSTSSLGVPDFRTRSTSPASNPVRSKHSSPEAEARRRTQYGLVSATEKYVGDAVSPRLETIDLYRRSAAKSNDPDLEFELAQYMVQTALVPAAEEAEADKGTARDAAADASAKSKLLKEALESLRRLANKGHATSQYLLGDILSTSAVGKPNHKASFHYFLAAAKHGHAEGAYRAAICLQQGYGTAPDAHRALKMYKTAASRGQPGALFRLGMAYFYAQLGITDNSTNRLVGLKWLGRAVNAATEIHNQAPYELGRIYEQGYRDVVIADLPYAVKLYVRSAELNYVPAALALGRAYEYGEVGCPQDAVLSIHYYTIAALGGDPKAQFAMCAWYMVGAGPRFPRNEDEAYEWALRAAHAGHPKAQLTLAMFYEKGIGCHRDIFQSTTWYRRAADNGDETALKRLKERNQYEDERSEKNCSIM